MSGWIESSEGCAGRNAHAREKKVLEERRAPRERGRMGTDAANGRAFATSACSRMNAAVDRTATSGGRRAAGGASSIGSSSSAAAAAAAAARTSRAPFPLSRRRSRGGERRRSRTFPARSTPEATEEASSAAAAAAVACVGEAIGQSNVFLPVKRTLKGKRG